MARKREEPVFVGVDLGTSAVKCMAIAGTGQVLGAGRAGYPTDTPADGWLEQDPVSWWPPVRRAVLECLHQAGISESRQIAAVALSGHMSGLVCLDSQGEPLHPCILIGDARSSPQATRLQREYGPRFRETTGNDPLAAFAVSRLLWLKEERPDVLEKTSCFLFPKDYLRFGLTGDRSTEPTDAANSLLLDLNSRDWDWARIEEIGLPRSIFPRVRESLASAGVVSVLGEQQSGLPRGTPVVMGGADMACSAIGSGAVLPGVLAVTLSSSGQVVASVDEIGGPAAGKLTFHPHVEPGRFYAMASIFTGGLGHSWANEVLAGGTGGPDERERAMEAVPPGSAGVLFLPFLTGSGSPRFCPSERGAWLGLGAGTTAAQMARSVLEGVACNIRENVPIFKRAGVRPSSVRLGGGGSRSGLWGVILASMLELPLESLEPRDVSVFGACIMAGINAGMFADCRSAAVDVIGCRQRVQPDRTAVESYKNLFRRYRQACRALRAVEPELDKT